MKLGRLILCIGGVLLLAGCDHQSKRESLEGYLDEVKSRDLSQIEPLPEVKPYETFTYSAMNLRSPFVAPEPEKVVLDLPEDNGIRPDVNRRKEPLEAFPLDSLRMVGTLMKNQTMWAIIVDSEGTVHRITQGNYLGQNHGKIQKVDEEKVFIKEIVSNPRGGWQEKEAVMALTEEQK